MVLHTFSFKTYVQGSLTMITVIDWRIGWDPEAIAIWMATTRMVNQLVNY